MEKWRISQGLLRLCSTRSRILNQNNPKFKVSVANAGSGSMYRLENACKSYRRLHQKLFNSSMDCHTRKLQASLSVTDRNSGLQCRLFGSATTKIDRNPHFSAISPGDIDHFKEILGEKNVIQDKDRLSTANLDWMRKYKGSSQLLLQPRTTEEVSQILKYCNTRCLAVVPQGGNTGLVGGSVPVFDEVIISIGSMNNIISFDKVSGILVCEAGCILENLDSFLANQGFMMPLDLGAKGSCQIGGNVSTNAGGLRFIRYGSLHGNVLGLEVVLANGTVVDMLGTLRKDNTGYDLKQLFIGSEGSLGIISKVSILTPPKLSSINLAFLACNDYLSCQKLLLEARRTLGEILSAFELLDNHSMDMVVTYLEGVRNPLPPTIYNFYILIETTGSNEANDKEKLESFLLCSMESGLISDGVVAQDMNQVSSFWRIREGITEALAKAGAVYKYDLSLPIEKLYEIVEEMRLRLGQSAKVVGYGHLGDGNLHLNISTSKYDDAVFTQIEPFVYEWTSKHRGSISAEHGLGLMKANKIHYSKSSEAVRWDSVFVHFSEVFGLHPDKGVLSLGEFLGKIKNLLGREPWMPRSQGTGNQLRCRGIHWNTFFYF